MAGAPGQNGERSDPVLIGKHTTGYLTVFAKPPQQQTASLPLAVLTGGVMAPHSLPTVYSQTHAACRSLLPACKVACQDRDRRDIATPHEQP